VFNDAPVWVDEVVGFALVAVVMLAAAQVLRRGEHISVDLLVGRLPAEGRRWLRALTRDPISKLGALLFASVLWGLFAAPVDYQRIIPQVPIDYRFPENAAALGDVPQRAEGIVTGSQMSLGRLRPDEISVSVDLANHGKGIHEIDLTDAAIIVPPGVQVVTIRPLRIGHSILGFSIYSFRFVIIPSWDGFHSERV